MLIRFFVLFLAILLAQPAPTALSAEESLGKTLKKIFATPTPTPKPHKKKRPSPTATKSPPGESGSPTPSPTSSPRKKRTPSAEEETSSPTPRKKKASPTPSPSASHPKKKASPSPEPSETPSVAPSATPEESPPATPSKKHGVPNATLLPDQIKGFNNYPAKVQKLLAFALDLTARNLDYKYGSADPANGGMDCSGFVYFVLKENAIADVPRDSSEQYNWLRRARAFEAVLSEKDDSFELDDLKPGDLLFWTGTYAIDRDPPITHSMIYLGRERKSGKRVMVGSSDGRVYEGESRYGVSVFDFNVHRAKATSDGKLHPVFIGYAHVPGLNE